MAKRKCKVCGDRFELIEGNEKFYTNKYCSDKCFSEHRKEHYKKVNKKTAEKNAEKFKDLGSGKKEFKCKNCKSKYERPASQAKHRGTSFCSNDCKKDHAKTKKKKEKSISQLKKDVWGKFSKYIRLRDAIRTTGGTNGVRCITCSAVKAIPECDAGHFYSRKYNSIFIDEHNVHAQCKKCNMPPCSGEQYLYSLQIIKLYGKDELERLNNARHLTKKFTKTELLDLYDHYSEEVKTMCDTHGSPWRKN